MSVKPIVAGVILAAGMSRRLGRPKQLLPLDGKPMLQQVLDAANRSKLDEVVVVLGHAAQEIEEKIDPGRSTVLVNTQYQKGQSTSVKAGLRSLKTDWDGVVMLLGDQPGVSSEVIDSLIEASGEDRSAIFMPTYRGERGNPVLIPKRLEAEMLGISGDQGARSILKRRSSEIRTVEINSERPPDIDTIEDWQRLGH